MAKRFYKTVTVAEIDDGFQIQLDGRTLKTPGKLSLTVLTRKLANLIAAEWEAQTDNIAPETMPVTRLVNVAIERTPDNRADLIAEVRRYAGSDLLCYRAPDPRDLTEQQAAKWGPWLDWVETKGAKLTVTTGIKAIDQAESSLDVFADYAASIDDMPLTLLTHFTAVFGSAVLAMAVMCGALEAEDALELSRLDEAYQNALWGEDEDAKIRTENIRVETLVLAQILPALACGK